MVRKFNVPVLILSCFLTCGCSTDSEKWSNFSNAWVEGVQKIDVQPHKRQAYEPTVKQKRYEVRGSNQELIATVQEQ